MRNDLPVLDVNGYLIDESYSEEESKLLEKKIQKLQEESDRQSCQIEELHEYVDILKKRNKTMREALEFYATKANWLYTGMYRNFDNQKFSHDDEGTAFYDAHKSITNKDIGSSGTLRYGGELARKALKEVGSENE